MFVSAIDDCKKTAFNYRPPRCDLGEWKATVVVTGLENSVRSKVRLEPRGAGIASRRIWA